MNVFNIYTVYFTNFFNIYTVFSTPCTDKIFACVCKYSRINVKILSPTRDFSSCVFTCKMNKKIISKILAVSAIGGCSFYAGICRERNKNQCAIQSQEVNTYHYTVWLHNNIDKFI